MRIKALIRKEFLQMIRDPSSILISIILPLVLLFLYGFGVSLDVHDLQVGVVMEDTSPLAQSFVRSLTDSTYFKITISRDRPSLYEKLLRDEIRGIVVIPSYFSRFFQNGHEVAPLQIITDGTEPNTANFVQNYVQGAWLNWLQQLKISDNLMGLPLIIAQPRYWYNEELESRNFLIPGSLGIIMTLIGTLLTALVIAREWERGTLEALMATPVKMWEFVIAKLIPYYVLGLLSFTGCILVSTLFYHVPLRGSLLMLYIAASAFLFCALGMGLLISSLARNQFVAAQGAMTIAYLPAFILSGFLFEISSMPIFIQWLTYLIPARYFVIALQTLFLVGDVWIVLFRSISIMMLFALVVFFITAKKTVKRLD